MARERYVNQVRLLVDILPAVAAEEEFALKGGTAINLFYRELPRLSVDVDLTFLPIKDRAQSLAEINAAMDRIAAAGSKLRNVTSTRIAGGGGGATRVMFQRGTATVKVETSPVMRGVVFEPEFKRVSPAVEDEFGFAETRLVAFEDLFAGKLHAALDRQHPRDLFDVKLLYEHEGITDDLFRAFLVYVASSNRPPHELLNPNLSPLDDVFVSTAPENPAMWRSKSVPGGARKACHRASSLAHGKGPRGGPFHTRRRFRRYQLVRISPVSGSIISPVSAGGRSRRRLRADEVFSR
jgi:predicted nucleotidyltransferase component of viral defense system